jgi:hypothetical protein
MAAAAGCMLLASTLLIPGGEQRQPALPDTIKELATKTFPDAKIIEIDQDEHDGEVEYSIDLRSRADDRALQLRIGSDAGVTRIQEQLRPSQIPAKVMKSLQKSFPKARIRDGRKNSEIRVAYKVDVELEGRRHIITFSPRGKVLEVDQRD